MFGNLFETPFDFMRKDTQISLTAGMLMSLYMRNACMINWHHVDIRTTKEWLKEFNKKDYPSEEFKHARGVMIGSLEKARKQLKKLVALQYALKAEYKGKC